MPDGLTVKPVITVTAVKQSASSGCHGALLNPGTEAGTYTCRECGNPCDLVLSDPEEVTFHG